MGKSAVILILFLLFQNTLCKLDRTWWKYTTVYKVLLPSYKDSDGDGLEDLSGLTSKLDHFLDLGIETLLISASYMSPMIDAGYDISDFTAVNPIFGTMDDFDELIAEANKNGIKVMVEAELNHSSDEHPWFVKSVDRIEPYTDFYQWRDPKYDSNGNRLPPNNWRSIFEGSAWTWNKERRQYYFHQFSRHEPDFNLNNELVKKELKKIMKFWLDRGVAGFGLDAVNFLVEDEEYRDEPLRAGLTESKEFWDQDHIYTLFTQETFRFLHEMRTYCDKVAEKFTDYERIFMPETYAPLDELRKYYGTENYKISHLPTNFALVTTDQQKNASYYNNMINNYLNAVPEGATPTWNLENHDKFSEDYEYIFTTMLMTLPGVALVYYGQEIGMTGAKPREDQRVNKYRDDLTGQPRDAARLVMQWNDSWNGGFSNASERYLPISANYWRINVQKQKNEKDSHYHKFKKLLDLRKTDAFRNGAFKSYVISTWVFAFTRISKNGDTYVVIMNLGSETEFVDLRISIPKLPNIMKVEMTSPNSGYRPDDEVSTHPAIPQILTLRPFAIMVLGSRL